MQTLSKSAHIFLVVVQMKRLGSASNWTLLPWSAIKLPKLFLVPLLFILSSFLTETWSFNSLALGRVSLDLRGGWETQMHISEWRKHKCTYLKGEKTQMHILVWRKQKCTYMREENTNAHIWGGEMQMHISEGGKCFTLCFQSNAARLPQRGTDDLTSPNAINPINMAPPKLHNFTASNLI